MGVTIKPRRGALGTPDDVAAPSATRRIRKRRRPARATEAAFRRQQLEAIQRERFRAQLASCPQCGRVVWISGDTILDVVRGNWGLVAELLEIRELFAQVDGFGYDLEHAWTCPVVLVEGLSPDETE